MIQYNRALVFELTFFYFCCVFWYGCFTPKKIIDNHPPMATSQYMQWRLNCQSYVYYPHQNTWQNINTISTKTRSLWKWIFGLFLLPTRFEVKCTTRRNVTWQFLWQTDWKFTFYTPRHLCRGVHSFRLSVRSFVRSFVLPSRSWNYFKVLRASNSSGVYLTNHSSESIHFWTIGTLEGRLSFHDSSPQGPCPGVGLEVKI